jgi:hypothetical protein
MSAGVLALVSRSILANCRKYLLDQKQKISVRTATMASAVII